MGFECREWVGPKVENQFGLGEKVPEVFEGAAGGV